MKYFPIKTAIVCFIFTPVLYVLTLFFSEIYLNQDYTQKVQNILIGDSKKILNGSIRLEEQIAANIDLLISRDWKIQKAKLDIKIQVFSKSGKIIYPIFLDGSTLEHSWGTEFTSETIAKQNYDILSNGLDVKVDVNIRHGSGIGNLVLILYFGISFLVFIMSYKVASSKAAKERELNVKEIDNLKKEEETYKEILTSLKLERQGLFENIKALNQKYEKDQEKAKVNEEEMIDEIISLEGKIKSIIKLKQKKENEISELKNQVQKFERRKSSKSKRNEFDFLEKRFSVLYKEVQIDRKALTGFLSLNEDQQIKAEEIIHQMDRDLEKIVIKRKVFSGKKHRTACFEVLFAYNGRLYFKKDKNNKTQIVVIGTKNTQSKDMEYLHSL